MASSSTNKQPLLIDRPLAAFTVLGSAAALSVSTNLNTVIGGNCAQMVDCGGNDGAIVDSIRVIATEASHDASARILVFLSTGSTPAAVTTANSVCIANAVVTSSAVGEATNVSLPPLLVPIPHNGGATSPTEFTRKNSGVMVPSGGYLYVGLNIALTAPSPASRVHVFLQGGFF